MKPLLLTLFFSIFIFYLYAQEENGLPLKYISSCEIDLNQDGFSDIALLVETVRGTELLALLKTKDGYNTFILKRDVNGVLLRGIYGKTVEETKSGIGKSDAKIYQTPGAYLSLSAPEGSESVFFWNGKDFTEVWTAD